MNGVMLGGRNIKVGVCRFVLECRLSFSMFEKNEGIKERKW